MGKKYLQSVLVVFLLLSSCAQQAPQAQPSQTPAPIAPTLTPLPTETPLVFALARLVVEGKALEAADGVYEFSKSVKPDDSLRVEVTITDKAPGSITLMGKTKEYRPGEMTVFLVKLPDALGSKDIGILVNGWDGSKLAYTLRLANPDATFEPALVAELPNQAYAGQALTFPFTVKSVGADNNFEIKMVKQVLGLGDRYTGNEYVTSQKLATLSLQGGNLSFLANTPGNYRISATASDGTKTRDFSVDIPVYWEPGKNPFTIRGVAIDTWGPADWVIFDNIPNVIDTVAGYGANYIQLTPWWRADGTPGKHKLVPCTPQDGCVTADDDALREWIRYAHSKNIKVLLKPHLTGGTFHQETTSYDFESWQIKPSDPDDWFEQYTAFIVHYARIAQDEGVDMFAVGNELIGTHTDVARWTKVIAAVKAVYHGPLTYSDPILWQMWDGQAQFWDQLDYIGVAYYYLGPNTKTPTIPAIEAAIKSVQGRNLARAMGKFETPVIATEFGRPNYDGSSANFTNWANATQDNQETVDYLEAGLNTMIALGPRFQGQFVWNVVTTPGSQPMAWDIRGKPAAQMLGFWFSH